jgi:2'-5' RNA ligase
MARDREKRPEAKKRRLFVAIEISDEAHDAVDRAIEPWRDEFPRARWVPRENRHVTMKFLGGTFPRLVDEVFEAVSAAAASTAPFHLTLGALGRFPERGRARVLWVGLEDEPKGALTALADAVQDAVPREFPPEKRAFSAHLTVARSDPPLPLPDAFEGSLVEPVTWTVDALTLFESHLRRPAPVYEPLLRAPLGG